MGAVTQKWNILLVLHPRCATPLQRWKVWTRSWSLWVWGRPFLCWCVGLCWCVVSQLQQSHTAARTPAHVRPEIAHTPVLAGTLSFRSVCINTPKQFFLNVLCFETCFGCFLFNRAQTQGYVQYFHQNLFCTWCKIWHCLFRVIVCSATKLIYVKYYWENTELPW